MGLTTDRVVLRSAGVFSAGWTDRGRGERSDRARSREETRRPRLAVAYRRVGLRLIGFVSGLTGFFSPPCPELTGLLTGQTFAPMSAMTATYPAPLPSSLTSFIGREREVREAGEEVAVKRLVTLTGAGGSGKTRLAASVAAQSPLRACFVDLTGAANDGDVSAIAAEALGVDSSSPPLTGIEAVLLATPALLVVDNCEHMLDAAASLVDHVLTHCPRTTVLATSAVARTASTAENTATAAAMRATISAETVT